MLCGSVACNKKKTNEAVKTLAAEFGFEPFCWRNGCLPLTSDCQTLVIIMNDLIPKEPSEIFISWETIMTTATTTTCCLYFVLVIAVLFVVTAANGFRFESLQNKKKHISEHWWPSSSWSTMKKRVSSNGADCRRSLSKSDLSASLSSMIPWWDDLAPPFALGDTSDTPFVDDDDEDDVNKNYYEDGMEDEADATTRTKSSITATTATVTSPPPTTVTHFCFLIHGHRGMARDLAYLQEVMRLLARRKKLKLQRRYKSMSLISSSTSPRRNSPVTTATTSSSDDEESDVSSSSTSTSTPSEPVAAMIHHDLIIHSAVCNEGKTTDGVAKGGDRLVEEMLAVIRNCMEQRQPQRRRKQSNSNSNDPLEDITVSVVGNSLGGIYIRYAIAQLVQRCIDAETPLTPDRQYNDRVHASPSGCYILDGRYRLNLNIFCTTASPHLGVSGHTYLPLPRTAELGVAHAMGLTGKDLFRVNDLMKRMATTPHFLTPLSQFRKRIAYANAYGTDFPVPAATAAFLSTASTYPHYFEQEQGDDADLWDDDDVDEEDDEDGVGDNGLIIATLHTPRQSLEHCGVKDDATTSTPNSTSLSTELESMTTDDLLIMSTNLDCLGWKKVFVDIRREIPIGMSLPSTLLKRTKSEIATAATSDDTTAMEGRESPLPPRRTHSLELRATLQDLRQRGRVESRDVAMAVCSAGDNTWNLPIGHNMIVAFSRSRISTLINKGGRPVVDALAKELVEDIFSWKSSSPARVSTSSNSTHDEGMTDQTDQATEGFSDSLIS